MSINLIMKSDCSPVRWKTFLRESEPFSIALDGYVNQGLRFQESGPRANFNHHEEVDRLATRATCSQVLMAIRQGLFRCFRNQNGPIVNVYANDCDEDVCMAWFLLKFGYLVEDTMNPIINRLVALSDVLDTTAGAYPFPTDLPMLQDLAWIFEPYRQFRFSGQLSKRDPSAFTSIVSDVEARIMMHVVGNGQSIPLDTSYETIKVGHGWTFAKEVGPYAKTGMFADGIRAYVTVRERHDGKLDITIGRMSMFIPFDVSNILARFNQEEGLIGKAECWGGGNTVGGSPRVVGTSLSVEQIFQIVESEVKSQQTK